MKFGFYLSHSDLHDLMILYNAHGGTDHKGLVFLLEITKVNPMEFSTTVVIKGVEGPIGGDTQIPDIPGTQKIPCPYPPPCARNADGIFITDATGHLQIDFADPDADCYS